MRDEGGMRVGHQDKCTGMASQSANTGLNPESKRERERESRERVCPGFPVQVSTWEEAPFTERGLDDHLLLF